MKKWNGVLIMKNGVIIIIIMKIMKKMANDEIVMK